MMKYIYLFITITVVSFSGCTPKEQNETASDAEDVQILVQNDYTNQNFHEPVALASNTFVPGKKPKNIILMIGDGMGTSQIYSGLAANKGQLNIQQCSHSGFSKTNASDSFITDSAAGATAFACGIKTYNGAIGVDPEKRPVKTILEMAEERGLATGLIATCKINHATPASFISHQPSRRMYEEIAADFLKTDVDLFIGGGLKYFNDREDGLDLTQQLIENGYDFYTDLDPLMASEGSKIAGLLAEDDPPRFSEGRGDMLIRSTQKALELLSKNENGFFLMVEGSQIDWGGHANETSYIVEEMLDFDRTIGEVLKFAEQDGETLVIITADHETGGFALNGGSIEEGRVEGAFTTGSHTAVLVPVFSHGSGAEHFTGMYENTAIYDKMIELYGWNETTKELAVQ